MARNLTDVLASICDSVPWLTAAPERSAPDGADASVRLLRDGDPIADLRLHAKNHLRPSVFAAWAARRSPPESQPPAVSVLGMPHVSPRLADLCRRAGWSWLDLAGNCHLDVPGVLDIQRLGQPPIRRAPRPGANLGTAAAGRVVRALLSPARAGQVWTQRHLQAETRWQGDEGVSLGLVNKVVRHLRDEGYVEGGRGFRVADPRGLLAAWREAYRFDRHVRHGWFTLLRGAKLEEALHRVERETGAIAYAAFSAAERQAPHVRQPRTWLYVAASALDALARHAEAHEVDSGENLVVLVPEDSGVFASFEASRSGDPALRCTDPVQTYVDLVHCGGRGEEAAQAVLEQSILPAWEAAVP